MIRKKIININYILTEWLFCRLTVDLIKNRIHGFSLSLSTPLSLSLNLSPSLSAKLCSMRELLLCTFEKESHCFWFKGRMTEYFHLVHFLLQNLHYAYI